MGFPKRKIVEKIRKDYPVGCEVVLDRMEDVQAPPVGTHGTVKSVDDTGSIKVAWRTGGRNAACAIEKGLGCACTH